MNTKDKSHIINRIRYREYIVFQEQIAQRRIDDQKIKAETDARQKYSRNITDILAITANYQNQYDILSPIYRAG